MSPRLHIGQKRILLRLVEAMDFVDKEDRAPPEFPQALGIGHHGFDFLNAGQHGAEGQKLALRHARDDARERGLADTRRSPKDDRSQLIALDLGAQRFARPENMFLAGEIVQRFRTHAVGKGTVCQAGGEIGERTGIEKAQAVTASRTRCRRAS